MAKTTKEVKRTRRTPQQASGPENLYDLDQVAQKMRNGTLEGMHAKDGHRQFTLMYEGSLSVNLFCFDEGGELPSHEVNGVSSVHVLDGQLVVETDHSQQVLADEDFFVMEPGVDHSIYAYEESRALLTIERQ